VDCYKGGYDSLGWKTPVAKEAVYCGWAGCAAGAFWVALETISADSCSRDLPSVAIPISLAVLTRTSSPEGWGCSTGTCVAGLWAVGCCVAVCTKAPIGSSKLFLAVSNSFLAFPREAASWGILLGPHMSRAITTMPITTHCIGSSNIGRTALDLLLSRVVDSQVQEYVAPRNVPLGGARTCESIVTVRRKG